MSDKNELQDLNQALDNYNYGVNPDDYPVNGKAIAEYLNALKAWQYLTVEQEREVIKTIQRLKETEPKLDATA